MTSGRVEDQACNPLRVRRGVLDRHPAAEGFALEMRPLHTELLEQAVQVLHVGGDFQRLGRVRRVAAAGVVVCDDAVAPGQRLDVVCVGFQVSRRAMHHHQGCALSSLEHPRVPLADLDELQPVRHIGKRVPDRDVFHSPHLQDRGALEC